MRRHARLAALALAPAGLLAGGCGPRAVVGELTPEEAQRCAVVLKAEGLDAVVGPDEGGDGARRQVSVRGDDADVATAVRALEAHGLPRRPAPGFETESASLIPTASEERARYIKGLSGEIEALLECVDGVESAEALVSLPERKPLAPHPDGAGASASVVISHAGPASPLGEDEVRSVVVRAVGAAITADRVSVLMKPIVRRLEPSPTVRYERDRVTEAVFAAAAAALAGAQAVTVWRMRAARRAGGRGRAGDGGA